jgi:glycosyltransferase involved in cell wall biosynthesis
LRCFFLQARAPQCEILIASEDDLDQGLAQPTFGANSPCPDVRFIKTSQGLTLPAKRNEAIAHARHPWITFWDDDDWSAPDRLEQAAKTIFGNQRATIVGQRWMYFHELRSERRFTYQYRYPNAGYVIGGLMTFHRSLWRVDPFRTYATSGDEGWWTVDRIRNGAEVAYTDIDYVAMIHGENTGNAALPRVAANGTVLSDSYMKLLGDREAAHTVTGDDLARF